MPAQLAQYFQRIGYTGVVTPTLEVLHGVHRAHVLNLTYENLDVLVGTPVDQDIERIFTKLVVNGRGGWCYEMNGLLGWALAEIGFSLTRLCGGVMREARGDSALGNHLLLKVAVAGEEWLADAGLGDGLLDPVRLQAGTVVQGARQFRLQRLGPGEWRFHNRAGGMPPNFDFFDRPADEARLQAVSLELQTDPESIFVQNLVCQRLTPDGGCMLLGLTAVDLATGERRQVCSAEELQEVLQSTFGIPRPDMAKLWPRVLARHEELFGAKVTP